MRNNQMGY
jgi:NAD(P)-dependent dehydrogenase (short-subunit alcohol dehydrogenase family)